MNGDPMKNKISDRLRSPVPTVVFMMTATVFAKALGMLRGMLIAYRYGTGISAEAFAAASQIPLTIFDFAFGAAVLGCFIPIYNSFNREDNRADEFARIFLNLILLVTALLAVIGIIFADAITAIAAPGLDADTKKLAAKLLRIMFPMIIFTGSAYTLVGIMQSKGRYFLPAMVSAVSNAGVIVYLLFFDRLFGENGIYGLAAAYIISWLLQLLTLFIPLSASGFDFIGMPSDREPGLALKRAIKMAPPIMFGSWLAPAAVISGMYFASFIDVKGAIAVFNYTNTVYIMIAGTLTYSICNYVFPLLSRLGNEDGDRWNHVVQKGIISSFAVIIPFAIAVYILAGEGISLYRRGNFTEQDMRETVQTLRCMSVGMPAFAFVEVVNRVFYSKNMVYIPMVASICGVVLNISACALFIQIETLRVGAVGLGCAVGQTAAAAVLVVYLFRRTGAIDKKAVITLIKLTAVSLISGAMMLTVYRIIGNDPYTASTAHNMIIAIIIVTVGAMVYFPGIKLTGIKLTAHG